MMASLEPDIAYRIAHHDDLTAPPAVEVIEVADGPRRSRHGADDHGRADRPQARSSRASVIASTVTSAAVVVAGDTVPCAGLDALCAGADALVHTVIRKDIIANVPIPRMQDTLDYHSSPEEAAQTAEPERGSAR